MACKQLLIWTLALTSANGLTQFIDPPEGQGDGEKTPATEPFEHMYSDSDSVARDVELRRGADFHPEGTQSEIDMTKQDKFKADSFFNQDPSVFGHCVLIRDVAAPLRVGSAMVKTSSFLRGGASKKNVASSTQVLAAGNSEPPPPERFVHFGDRSPAQKTFMLQNGTDDEPLPGNALIPKGGVMDRDTGNAIGDNDTTDGDAELEVNMFAFLRSIAGEVAVIPHGDIGKWSSKKKVPIAGYLCTSEQGPVLHTLPTPCVPTSLDENGEPFPPPAAPQPEFRQENETVVPSEPYHVWVGDALLDFRSKPKAERFCKRLTKRIAEDDGDAEWDTERLFPPEVNKKDMLVSSFMALSRKPSRDWTIGAKSCLVVVMDWMRGDSSRAPHSRQKQTPRHYEREIFPRVREAFQRMSYGQFDISVTVVPEVVRFTRPRSRYTARGYPFPGIYDGAKDSMAAHRTFRRKYNFDNYDLVYVISPQQAPTGTKGVAWVGAKGAMCNGCEEISDNFQVMVAVHELGHNLGLWHAGSKSLEYGNVFDWMGNYPDVTGLSFGLGYKLRLNWLPQASIAKISDADVPSLNDEYHLMPFDSKDAPVSGQLTGIEINLRKNRRNLYISYRKEPGSDNAGIFLTLQDRDKPNSEIIDCACHSPSQQDAALRQGWTFIDPTGQVVIHAHKVEGELATVRIYKVPRSSRDQGAIRARKGFTDGQWKCPRVCTDSDLLVSQYDGCGKLAKDGYCRGGSITMSGKKFSIGGDLCPKSCDQCDAVTSGSSGSRASCADKNVKISGMNCRRIAAKGFCDRSTNIGHIGDDLCPKSCGNCPARPAAGSSSSSSSFTDPQPARTHGVKAASPGQAPSKPETRERRNYQVAAKEEAEERSADEQENRAERKKENSGSRDTCTDDVVWTDEDGDGCEVYDSYIKQGKLTQDEACGYAKGAPKVYCRKTCSTCQAISTSGTCEDKQCVSRWRYERGKCFSCSEWKGHCGKDFFAHDCPRTCGLCKANGPDTTPPLPKPPVPAATTLAPTMPPTSPPTRPPKCQDDRCVMSWLKSFGKCHKCEDFAADYCGRDELFMKSCPKSCKICVDGEPACHDDFLPHTCKRYTEWGWCSTPHIAAHCKASCGQCAAAAKIESADGPKLERGDKEMKGKMDHAGSRQKSMPLLGLLAAMLFSAFF